MAHPYLCALTGDAKAMAAGNPRQGCRCWVCSRSTADFNTAFEPEDEDTGARFGRLHQWSPPGGALETAPTVPHGL